MVLTGETGTFDERTDRRGERLARSGTNGWRAAGQAFGVRQGERLACGGASGWRAAWQMADTEWRTMQKGGSNKMEPPLHVLPKPARPTLKRGQRLRAEREAVGNEVHVPYPYGSGGRGRDSYGGSPSRSWQPGPRRPRRAWRQSRSRRPSPTSAWRSAAPYARAPCARG